MSGVLAAAAGGHGSASAWAFAAGVVLLALNGFFVAAEIALLAARRARVEERAEAGDPRAVVAMAALSELSVTFSGAQLGITMCSLGLGAILEPALASVIEPVLPLPAGSRPAVAFGLSLAIVVFLHMVVGEMAPKNLALAQAEDVSLRLARSFRLFVTVFRPLIVALNAVANALVRLVGVEPVDERELVHTPDELVIALRESRRVGQLEAQEARVLTAILQLRDLDAEAAMTPRVDVVALPDTATADELLVVAAETGLTRLPVYHGDIDQVTGLVHVKDALIRDDLDGVTVEDLLRPILAVPERRDAEQLLREMRDSGSHVALVVDEFGGTAGVVALEDLLEELVGDIVDEFDPAQVAAVRAAGGWVVDGLTRRDELSALTGLQLPEGATETVSGYVTERLGRIPRSGDAVELAGWRLRVRSMEGLRAGRIEVVPPPATGHPSGPAT